MRYDTDDRSGRGRARRRATPWLAWLAVAGVAIAWVGPARADLLSKTFEYDAGRVLAVGSDVGKGIRIESVEFLPGRSGGRKPLLGGGPKVDVLVANTGEEPQKIGIAVAVYEPGGALVGVASGGSKWIAIKPGRKSYYTLSFDDVRRYFSRASKFQITVETK